MKPDDPTPENGASNTPAPANSASITPAATVAQTAGEPDAAPAALGSPEDAPGRAGGKKLSPEEEKLHYEEAWRTLDQHYKRFWLGVILFAPVVLIVTAIIGHFLHRQFLYGLFAFGIALAVYFAIRWALKLDQGDSVHDFVCPRCGNPFFRKEKRTDTLSRKCLNCSLPRGAMPPYFDPPVKPKSPKK